MHPLPLLPAPPYLLPASASCRDGLCKLENDASRAPRCDAVGVEIWLIVSKFPSSLMSDAVDEFALDERRCGFLGPYVVITCIEKLESEREMPVVWDHFARRHKCWSLRATHSLIVAAYYLQTDWQYRIHIHLNTHSMQLAGCYQRSPRFLTRIQWCQRKKAKEKLPRLMGPTNSELANGRNNRFCKHYLPILTRLCEFVYVCIYDRYGFYWHFSVRSIDVGLFLRYAMVLLTRFANRLRFVWLDVITLQKS